MFNRHNRTTMTGAPMISAPMLQACWDDSGFFLQRPKKKHRSSMFSSSPKWEQRKVSAAFFNQLKRDTKELKAFERLFDYRPDPAPKLTVPSLPVFQLSPPPALDPICSNEHGRSLLMGPVGTSGGILGMLQTSILDVKHHQLLAVSVREGRLSFQQLQGLAICMWKVLKQPNGVLSEPFFQAKDYHHIDSVGSIDRMIQNYTARRWVTTVLTVVCDKGSATAEDVEPYPLSERTTHKNQLADVLLPNEHMREAFGEFLDTEDWGKLRTLCARMCSLHTSSTATIAINPSFLVRDCNTFEIYCEHLHIRVTKSIRNREALKCIRRGFFDFGADGKHTLSMDVASTDSCRDVLAVLRTSSEWSVRCRSIRCVRIKIRGHVKRKVNYGSLFATISMMFPDAEDIQLTGGNPKMLSNTIDNPAPENHSPEHDMHALVEEGQSVVGTPHVYKPFKFYSSPFAQTTINGKLLGSVRMRSFLSSVTKLTITVGESNFGSTWATQLLLFRGLEALDISFVSGKTRRALYVYNHMLENNKSSLKSLKVSFAPNHHVVEDGPLIAIPLSVPTVTVCCNKTRYIATRDGVTMPSRVQHVFLHVSTTGPREAKRIANSEQRDPVRVHVIIKKQVVQEYERA